MVDLAKWMIRIILVIVAIIVIYFILTKFNINGGNSDSMDNESND